jgi:hypothetical protein
MLRDKNGRPAADASPETISAWWHKAAPHDRENLVRDLGLSGVWEALAAAV